MQSGKITPLICKEGQGWYRFIVQYPSNLSLQMGGFEKCL